MDVGLLAQYIMNGLMLGMMYALVAVGFTLFFGVLDVIKFSHGDVLTVGAFTALATYRRAAASVGVSSILADAARRCWSSRSSPWRSLGMLIARYLVLPLRSAPALNTLLITLMLGTVLREVRAAVLSARRQSRSRFRRCCRPASINFGNFNLRLDNAIMLAAGVAGHRRPAAPAQPHQARPRHPRGGAGRGDRAHHGHQLHRHRAGHVRDRLGAGRLRRRDERALLQRDQFRHGPSARRRSALPPRSSAGSAASTAPSSAASCSRRCRPSAPSRCRSPAPTRTCSPSPS